MKETHYKIPIDLHKEFKVYCAKEGKTMQQVIVRLVRAWIRGIKRGLV